MKKRKPRPLNCDSSSRLKKLAIAADVWNRLRSIVLAELDKMMIDESFSGQPVASSFEALGHS